MKPRGVYAGLEMDWDSLQASSIRVSTCGVHPLELAANYTSLCDGFPTLVKLDQRARAQLITIVIAYMGMIESKPWSRTPELFEDAAESLVQLHPDGLSGGIMYYLSLIDGRLFLVCVHGQSSGTAILAEGGATICSWNEMTITLGD